MILGERHLRAAINSHMVHYHRERNHQGLDNELIEPWDAGVPDPAAAAAPTSTSPAGTTGATDITVDGDVITTASVDDTVVAVTAATGPVKHRKRQGGLLSCYHRKAA